MPSGRMGPLAKGSVNLNFAERMDVTATLDCREGYYWEIDAGEET